MEQTNQSISIDVIVNRFQLKNFTPDVDPATRSVSIADINRPALQLHGFYEYFDPTRIQVIGMVEKSYLESKTAEDRAAVYEKLLSYDIPCIIFSREFEPEETLKEKAIAHGVPILGTHRGTSEIVAELIYYMSEQLAPCISIHGVLVDVYGEGVLITGESGIGKSEAALELIRRGHRLVSDDVVEIRKVNDHRLVGRAPDITRHFIELRGIGIVDVKSLFGVECVKDRQKISLVIKLEDWKKDAEYDRLGLQDEYTEILGNKITCHNVPIRPGRNLAVIVESAAVNHRQKKMGYNAAQELYRRVNDNIAKKSESLAQGEEN